MCPRKLSRRTLGPLCRPLITFLHINCIFSHVCQISLFGSARLTTSVLAAVPPKDVNSDMVVPNDTPLAYTFPLSQVNATQLMGGSVKVADMRTFPAATTICAAEVTVEPNGMRYVPSCSHAYRLIQVLLGNFM